MPNIKRIQLLSETEITDLYARPTFDHCERSLYFILTTRELEAVNRYSTIKTRVYFILQLGYFKAKQQFFQFKFEDVSSDVQYILSIFFDNTKAIFSGQISRSSIKQQKDDILKLFEYHDWSPKYQPQIEAHVSELLRYYPKCHGALRQLLSYFDSQQIIVPSYRTLQDMFTAALSNEEKRLSKIILSIPEYPRQQLSALIERNDGISQLNILRADQKDFKYTAVRNEIKKAQEITELYEFAKDFIPTLKLSKNAIRYYADVAGQYAPFRLRRLNKSQQWLYALCFVYHRYQEIMDNLIISFIYHIRKIIEDGKTYAEAALAEHSAHMVVAFPKLAHFLRWFPQRDKDLTHIALNQEAYNILPEEQFALLAEFFDGTTFDTKAAKWKFYATVARLFALYLRPILLTVPFTFYKENSQLIDFINVLKKHYAKGKNPATFKLPDELLHAIPKDILPYLKRNPTDTQINPYLFEFFVYQKMYHQIDRGRLCCNESISYCDIDCDLVEDAIVDDVEKIAAEFGYPKIPIYCDKHLDDVVETLDQAWDRTTKNIASGSNTGFSVKKNKAGKEEWHLLYDSSVELDDAFFKTLPKVNIADVIMFIGDRVGMWDGFAHMKDRYIKRKRPVVLAIIACLLAEAFGISTAKMAEMSDINFNSLRSTHEDFFHIDALCRTNDIVADYIHSLPIFKLWNLMENKILADADGQKMATSDNTIQSRYSKKFIGKGRGISLYTLIANFVAVNAKNIGLNEYEGHSLFDMIYGNKTDIDINMVTGDNHSLNQLNFVALDAIDVEYVPSIKNVREAANDLYSSRSPESYTGLLLPKNKIKIDRIKSQKRGILRVLLSLIMQENTQSNIIRKLNSHARYARLRAALFEYNKILKSTHILNMIDNMELRKAMRTARNRTEAYHRLQGLIRKVYNGIFKGKKIVGNRISAHAARLIANCIVAYNSIILNAVYEKMVQSGVPQYIIEEFARISPIAWVHIIFTGRYNFKKSMGFIDVAAMAQEIEKQLKQHFWRPA
jgi:TnpA family transposase